MMRTLIGYDLFRKGMELYFDRNDGTHLALTPTLTLTLTLTLTPTLTLTLTLTLTRQGRDVRRLPPSDGGRERQESRPVRAVVSAGRHAHRACHLGV